MSEKFLSGKNANEEAHWFGNERVAPEEKTGRVRAVFESVASRYDLMNDLMSGGVHRLWKAQLIAQVKPRADAVYLDVAGGTGDIAFRYLESLPDKRPSESGSVTVCDINPSMLDVGRERAAKRGFADRIEWVEGNAEHLPFADNSVDTYTIAFGLRNVTDIDAALRDAHRVLKPGGRFFCLEFSRVVLPGLREAYDQFSFKVIPRIGQLVAKDRESYQYLVESIRRFPPQKALAKRMEKAGFDLVSVRNLSAGIAAIHAGWKL
jgi:demethylmenaquinone methyltransferase/2-methoxy-6-polyprenyl-1,4-benzoquinol methylase